MTNSGNLLKKTYYNEITWMKAIATVFITWFHFKWFVPQQLAPVFIGGAIGNSLFFFCSGYLLSFKNEKYFGQWMLRKYLRIMPVVWITFAICLATCSFTDCHWIPESLNTWFMPKYYWFVCSILLYYLICRISKPFIANNNSGRNILILICVTCIVQILWYVFFCDKKNVNLDEGYIKAWYFFAFFLWGYYCRQKKVKVNKPKVLGFFAPISLILFFAYKFFAAKNACLAYWQVIFVPMLLLFVILSFWGLSRRLAVASIPMCLKHIIIFVSSITLEIYIVQIHVIEYFMPRILFPYNILVSMCFILLFAYIVHRICLLLSNWLKWI